MHASVGTGSLAYTVGSKLMDVRLSCREDPAPIVESHGTEGENLNAIARDLRSAADVQEGTSSSDEPSLQEPLPGEVDSSQPTQLQQKPGAAGPVKKRTSTEVDRTPEVDDSTVKDMDIEGLKEEDVPAKEDSSFMKAIDLDSLPGPRLSGEAERVTDWLWTLHRIGKLRNLMHQYTSS